jgi:3-deoxy-D-manno-octulosonic-acid transferase
VWFHAASVGEAASLLELLRRLTTERPGLTCLVTTVTVTSQQFLANRLPERCIHQFVPVDVRPWMARFLDHWRPDMAVWTESEFWPAMLVETHARGIPMLLMNARISERSYKRWRVAGALPASLLQRFGRVLAQDDLAGEHLRALGADPDRLTVTGTLKEGAAPLPHDEDERKRVTRAFKGRPVWLAASTHSGEEEAAIAAHLTARKVYPQLALVLVPRHPVRGDGLAEMLRGEGFELAQRSKGETVGEDTDICLADTLGELGLWYRLATVSFVGGSLVEVGGHNPFEPALLGSAILHGPHVRNFAGAYERLEHAGAAVEVRDGENLGAALITALRPDRAAAMAAAGWAACSEGADVTDTVLEAITSVLDAPG